MATYPDAIRAFTQRVDRVDIASADDVNALQDEVVAVQKAVGRNPQTSASYPSATSLSERITLLEQDVLPRLKIVEDRLRRAAVTVRRAAALQYNSSASWQALVMPDVVQSLNDYGLTPPIYDVGQGRFFSVAASPALWSLSASVTWEPSASPVGVRGLALTTAAGTVLAATELPAVANEEVTLSVSWTGRLPVDPAFYLSLSVKQTQGTALFLRGDTTTTPCRADFTHIPG